MSLIDPISVPPDDVRLAPTAAGMHPCLPKAAGSDGLCVMLLPADRLTAADRHGWATLSRHAAPGNIFAADWLMATALTTAARQPRLAVVADAAGTWLGALPLFSGMLSPRTPIPVLRSWHCPAGGIGTPLLRAGAERAFWGALLAHLDRHPGLAAGLIVDALPLDDPATLALASLCAEQQRALHTTGGVTRSARVAGNPGDPRAIAVLEKRFGALEQRLVARHGAVRLVLHQRASDCEPWLAAFLALERARPGPQRPAPEALRAAIRKAHRRGAVRLASLTAGETIVAMSGWLVADKRGYGLATAYDTRFAGFAPHRLLMRRVVELAALEGLSRFDSCAVSDPGSEALWPDRRQFAGFGVSLGGRGRRALFARAMGRMPA